MFYLFYFFDSWKRKQTMTHQGTWLGDDRTKVQMHRPEEHSRRNRSHRRTASWIERDLYN